MLNWLKGLFGAKLNPYKPDILNLVKFLMRADKDDICLVSLKDWYCLVDHFKPGYFTTTKCRREIFSILDPYAEKPKFKDVIVEWHGMAKDGYGLIVQGGYDESKKA